MATTPVLGISGYSLLLLSKTPQDLFRGPKRYALVIAHGGSSQLSFLSGFVSSRILETLIKSFYVCSVPEYPANDSDIHHAQFRIHHHAPSFHPFRMRSGARKRRIHSTGVTSSR